MNWWAAQLKVLTVLWAFILTPVAILLGYNLVGPISAVQFNIIDFDADFTEGLFAAALLLLSIQFWPVSTQHRRILSLLWLVRIGVALGFMLPYEAFYGLDAALYYAAGTHANDPFSWFRFGSGTFNMIGMVGVLSKLTTSYSALKLIFAYVGLGAIYIFYRTTAMVLQREIPALLYLLGVFPSILFWSSILGKDPVTLLGIAIFCHGAAGLIAGRGLHMLIFVTAGLVIAAFIRIWLGAVFLTPLLVAVVLGGRMSLALKVLFLILTVPLFLVLLQSFANQFSVETASDLVARTDQISQSWARGGSAQQIEGGFRSLTEMILFMPFGAFTALFRPLPGEIQNVFGFMAGLENAFLLGLMIYGFMRRGLTWMRQPLLLWTALTLGAWSAVYGFASYQNLGTAFRFHVQVAPLILLTGLYLSFYSGRGVPQIRRPVLTIRIAGRETGTR